MSFEIRECRGGEEQQRKVDGEGVVLLVGGEREEAEDDDGEDGEQEDGPLGEGTPGGVAEAVALTPSDGDRGGGKEAPGEEPDDVQRPVECGGKLVVVAGYASAEEARDVFVVEVEPRPSGVRWEAGAGGHGNGRVAQRGEDVPGRGDGEQERDTGEGMKQTPATPLAGEDEEEADGGEEEDDGDEALGEHGAG